MKYTFLFLLCLSAIISRAQAPQNATALMDAAFAEAAKTNKNVFLVFHASWCGWCHKMDSSMADPRVKQYFDDNYVIRHLTVRESGAKKALENPGAEAMLVKYKGDDQGIPYWLVFDAKGRLLADAQIRPEGAGPEAPGKNTGCPATAPEVEYFISVLKKTARLQETDLQKIRIVFRENDQ